MSDLDQAIREHLALKRQHGADPSEVARLAEEALGEVSRNAVEELSHEPASHVYLVEDSAPLEAERSPREELVPPTNEYARTRARSYMDGGEETQEYSVEDQGSWFGGAAWQGGAA
jgi:hypothetical protein